MHVWATPGFWRRQISPRLMPRACSYLEMRLSKFGGGQGSCMHVQQVWGGGRGSGTEEDPCAACRSRPEPKYEPDAGPEEGGAVRRSAEPNPGRGMDLQV